MVSWHSCIASDAGTSAHLQVDCLLSELDLLSLPAQPGPYNIRRLSGTSLNELCEQLKVTDRSLRERQANDVECSQADVDSEKAKKREERLNTVKAKIEGLGHRGCCGIWVGSTADELLEDLHGLEDIGMLQDLLDFEIKRQHNRKAHERNNAMVHELKRRLRAELVIESPMIQKVRAAISLLLIAAVASCTLL